MSTTKNLVTECKIEAFSIFNERFGDFCFDWFRRLFPSLDLALSTNQKRAFQIQKRKCIFFFFDLKKVVVRPPHPQLGSALSMPRPDSTTSRNGGRMPAAASSSTQSSSSDSSSRMALARHRAAGASRVNGRGQMGSQRGVAGSSSTMPPPSSSGPPPARTRKKRRSLLLRGGAMAGRGPIVAPSPSMAMRTATMGSTPLKR